jgi:hypothetical protein
MSELIKAFCAFHKDVDTIHKEAKAQYGAFADLATVLSTVLPALTRNGLAVTQTFEPVAESDPVLVTTLHHVSGESICSRLPMVIGKGRNPLHDFGGSTTYLRRYALLALLCLVADVDTDGDLGEPEEPAPAIAKAVKSSRGAAKPVAETKPATDTQGTRDQFFEAALAKGLTTHAAEDLAGKLKGNYAGGIDRLAEKDAKWVEQYNASCAPKEASAAADGSQW